MSIVKLIEELEEKNKRIAKLEKAIRFALNNRDLWGVPKDLKKVEECHMGEMEALNTMEQSFKQLIEQ